MKEYSGIKFNAIFLEETIPFFPQINELKKWGKKFSDMNFIPHYKNEKEPDRLSSAGNLSSRNNNGFVITASYSDLANLREIDFVEVKKVDLNQKKIWINGQKEPSSETMLHYAIYQERNDVNAIFHGHSNKLLNNYKKLRLISTKYEADYGSIELINSVMEVLKNENFLIIKNHGFLSFGNTIEQAGNEIMNINIRLRNI